MAQNSYGLKIMGGVAFVFGLIFIVEFITAFGKKETKDGMHWQNRQPMILFSRYSDLRIFYIHFPYIELLFGAAGVLLVFFICGNCLFASVDSC